MSKQQLVGVEHLMATNIPSMVADHTAVKYAVYLGA